jgi:hypothetical protein
MAALLSVCADERFIALDAIEPQFYAVPRNLRVGGASDRPVDNLKIWRNRATNAALRRPHRGYYRGQDFSAASDCKYADDQV